MRDHDKRKPGPGDRTILRSPHRDIADLEIRDRVRTGIPDRSRKRWFSRLGRHLEQLKARSLAHRGGHAQQPSREH
jgi:hypothetical protein